MYPGHFAAGLVLKTIRPEAPTWGLMVGVGLLDWLFGAFVAFGVEGGTIGHLHIPWSHSLLMSILWAGLFAGLFRRRGRTVMILMACAVMSHWVLDLVSHQPDLTLTPLDAATIGLGAYFGGLAGWGEVVVSIAALIWYVWSATKAGSYGGRPGVVACVMFLLYGAEYFAVS